METFIVNGTHIYTIIQFCAALMKPAFTVVTSDPVYSRFTKDGPCVWVRVPFLADVAYPFRVPSIGRNVGIGGRMRTFCWNEKRLTPFPLPLLIKAFSLPLPLGLPLLIFLLGVFATTSYKKELDITPSPL